MKPMNICYISNSAAPSKNASSLKTAKFFNEKYLVLIYLGSLDRHICL